MARQVLILQLGEITASDYLQYVRDPDPPALAGGLRSVCLDDDPLGDTITAVLDWAGPPPPVRLAAPAAGLPLSDGVHVRAGAVGTTCAGFKPLQRTSAGGPL